MAGDYFCVICGECRIEWADDGARVVVHNDVPHPDFLTYDEEDHPQ